MKYPNRIALAGFTLGALLLGVQATSFFVPDCPPQGSRGVGVANWEAENCPDDGCANIATTCNGQFQIEFLGTSTSGSHVTYEYKVCQIAGQAALSHWSFGTGLLGCLGDGFTLEDLFVGATQNGLPTIFEIGLDPTTQVLGFKFDQGVRGGGCNDFTVTLDGSVLASNFSLGTGCVLAATKAGNQDIRFANVPSPGYACVVGPACVDVPPPSAEGCSPGFWKNHTAAWVVTGYAPDDLIGSVFQGSLYDNVTLHAALSFMGGPDIPGAQRILLRQAVASLLNAADPGIDFGLTEAQVIDKVETALATNDRREMLELASELDTLNNAGCPR